MLVNFAQIFVGWEVWLTTTDWILVMMQIMIQMQGIFKGNFTVARQEQLYEICW